MATQPALPNLPAPRSPRRSTRRSSSARAVPKAKLTHFLPHEISDYPRSADIAGRAVTISPDVPLGFDQPLAAHHKIIGGWVAASDRSAMRYTSWEARRRIERDFEAAVLNLLRPLTLANFRVAVLAGDEAESPAIAVICDSIGQLDLGWIEDSDAPVAWRATAYSALETMLGTALPIFGYQDLFDEISLYYWDGETDDEAARQCMISYHGVDPADLDGLTLPSEFNGRRPEWMISEASASNRTLPAGLRRALRALRASHSRLLRLPEDRNAWRFDLDLIHEHVPHFEECSTLPPLTLVPVDVFGREIDDVARHGMEYGFMDVAGICSVDRPGVLDDWFSSFRAGAEFLLGAQNLIQLDPSTL
jgi:hypothetical protein